MGADQPELKDRVAGSRTHQLGLECGSRQPDVSHLRSLHLKIVPKPPTFVSTGFSRTLPCASELQMFHTSSITSSAMAKRGLYANIHAKRKAGKKPRKPGAKGAPTAQDFKNAARTAKKKK